ncbi:MAG: CBS domain-containing protein [Myxococcales bacterium]|nr:CBS domain-containing protein [Myxococcales bacterium]
MHTATHLPDETSESLGLDPELRVADIMTRDVVTLSADDTLALAEDVMALGRFRHLPVVDLDGKAVVGLVTHRDLIGAMARALAGFTAQERSWFGREAVARTLRIGDVMQIYPLTVAPHTRIYDAACLLRLNKFGCLPVVDDSGHLCGILTEADFVELFANSERRPTC